MRLKRDNGAWVVVDFRYERLPTFCFFCGVLGHGDKYCHKVLRGVDPALEMPYGSWLRAGMRRTATPARRFRSEAVVNAIGAFIGSFVKSDERNFDSSMHSTESVSP
nr:uncharacterized protein LOC109184755 [Ipomoea trifida]GME04864.1 uncharacterized protein LOC109184755 [Ipomoea batatas]GME17380.1 uncharacterized protein LOC109184755 [Ipomoea batatas]